MKAHLAFASLLFCSTLLWSSCRSEKALWIELREHGVRTTTIAMTEGIARQLLDTKNMKVNFTEEEKAQLVTRDMLQAVLIGSQASMKSQDEEGDEAIVSMKSLSVPRERGGNDRLVLETYKSGKQTFRLALSELEMEQADAKTDESVKVNFGWRALLPFLARVGGAVYIRNEEDGTEVWLYVE
jgi:hypothetical protein